ncbi:MAG: diguanylate cyclase [Deltaproteobacteria bacterium]|nr:diguanylate cyclase [Deltaproteobacteria bacterium]MBW2153474.1 diguanylate cyclase [Deltaproteobacteria bacterium]
MANLSVCDSLENWQDMPQRKIIRPLAELVSINKDRLMQKAVEYIKEHEPSKSTASMDAARKHFILDLLASLQSALTKGFKHQTLDSGEELTEDPAWALGMAGALRRRELGIVPVAFLGWMKSCRHTCKDLIGNSRFEHGYRTCWFQMVESFFDRVELGFCEQLLTLTEEEKKVKSQATAVTAINEANKYLSAFESLPNPIIFVDRNQRIETANRSASRLLLSYLKRDHRHDKTTGRGRRKNLRGELIGTYLPWITVELDNFIRSRQQRKSIEKRIETSGEKHYFQVRFSKMNKPSGQSHGIIVSLEDVTEHKQAEEALQKTTSDLKQNIKELERANRQILNQQKAVIEEERLKVLLQMAGATAHELNQPLMALLGNIELIGFEKNNPEKVMKRITKIEDAGKRIADIVKRILTIRHYEVKPYAGSASVVNLDQSINVLSVEDSDEDFTQLEASLADHHQINLLRAKDVKEAFRILASVHLDLIFLDYLLPSGTGLEFMKKMQKKALDIPVVFITGQGDEMVASQAINAGAYDYLPKANANSKSLTRVIQNALEKFRLKQEVKRAMEKMAELSTRDELTGLYNRRYFLEIFEREIATALRYKTKLVLCMMDLDHFKRINDRYGHTAGDEVLRHVAQQLGKSVRKSDIPCRYGGEEFVVVLPNTGSKHAKIFCERFRKSIEALSIQYNGQQMRVTISIGLAQYDISSARSTAELLEKADTALYVAKKEGRNRVEVIN